MLVKHRSFNFVLEVQVAVEDVEGKVESEAQDHFFSLMKERNVEQDQTLSISTTASKRSERSNLQDLNTAWISACAPNHNHHRTDTMKSVLYRSSDRQNCKCFPQGHSAVSTH